MKNLEKKHQQRIQSWLAMQKALQPVAQEIRSLWSQSVTEVFQSRWEVGSRINAAYSDPARYGKAEQQLHKHFQSGFQNLADDARVAGQFVRETVVKLAQDEMQGGGHITWSHLVMLSAIPSGATRDRLVEKTYKSALTPDDLAREIAASADVPCAVAFHAPVKEGTLAAGRSMNVATALVLQNLVTEIEGLQTAAASSPLLGHWEIGRRVAYIIVEENRYGSNAIDLTARFLGCRAAQLYDLARYAKVFDRQTLEQLAARKAPDGGRLTWEHMVLVAAIASPARRQSLLDAVTTECLSVQKLKRHIGSKKDLSLPPHLRPENPPPPTSALDGITRIRRTVAAMNKRAELWTAVADSITENVKPAPIDSLLLRQLQNTNEQLTDFLQWLPRYSEKLSKAVARCKKVLASRTKAASDTHAT